MIVILNDWFAIIPSKILSMKNYKNLHIDSFSRDLSTEGTRNPMCYGGLVSYRAFLVVGGQIFKRNRRLETGPLA